MLGEMQVPISTMDSALDWLKGQTALRDNYPNIYFSRRFSSAPITDGILAADSVQNGTNAIAGIERYLCLLFALFSAHMHPEII